MIENLCHQQLPGLAQLKSRLLSPYLGCANKLLDAEVCDTVSLKIHHDFFRIISTSFQFVLNKRYFVFQSSIGNNLVGTVFTKV